MISGLGRPGRSSRPGPWAPAGTSTKGLPGAASPGTANRRVTKDPHHCSEQESAEPATGGPRQHRPNPNPRFHMKPAQAVCNCVGRPPHPPPTTHSCTAGRVRRAHHWRHPRKQPGQARLRDWSTIRAGCSHAASPPAPRWPRHSSDTLGTANQPASMAGIGHSVCDSSYPLAPPRLGQGLGARVGDALDNTPHTVHIRRLRIRETDHECREDPPRPEGASGSQGRLRLAAIWTKRAIRKTNSGPIQTNYTGPPASKDAKSRPRDHPPSRLDIQRSHPARSLRENRLRAPPPAKRPQETP